MFCFRLNEKSSVVASLLKRPGQAEKKIPRTRKIMGASSRLTTQSHEKARWECQACPRQNGRYRSFEESAKGTCLFFAGPGLSLSYWARRFANLNQFSRVRKKVRKERVPSKKRSPKINPETLAIFLGVKSKTGQKLSTQGEEVNAELKLFFFLCT